MFHFCQMQPHGQSYQSFRSRGSNLPHGLPVEIILIDTCGNLKSWAEFTFVPATSGSAPSGSAGALRLEAGAGHTTAYARPGRKRQRSNETHAAESAATAAKE
jgi:hypothetical protein